MRSTPDALPQQEPTPAQLPMASFWKRALGFVLDLVLLHFISLFVLFNYLIPSRFPQEWAGFKQHVHQYVADNKTAAEPVPFALKPEHTEMLSYVQSAWVLMAWSYFLTSDWLAGGRSLGKRVFSLQAVRHPGGQALGFGDACLRATLKTISLTYGFPFLIANYLVPLFNPLRLAGHDYICKTAVCYLDDTEAPPLEASSTENT
jgi:uncharacterized RDD family membrane protein YckC